MATKKAKATKTTKVAAKSAKKSSKIESIIKLMQKKDGATIHDFVKAGFKQPSMVAVNAAKRRGLKPKVTHRKGELTRYSA